jgi:Tfp pilus assembly protein PilV
MMTLIVRRSERGVTLAEVLIALFILGFVGVAVIAGVFASVKSNDTARTRITAESLARSELEFVNSQEDISQGDWSYTLPDGPPTWDLSHTALPQDSAGYSIYVSSSKIVEQVATKDRRQLITAIVSYKDDDILTDDEVLKIETWRFEQ